MTETCTDIAQLPCNRALRNDGKKKSRFQRNALSYHITYNERKIVVSVDDLGLLPSKISHKLNLDVDATNLSAQVYMEDWQDWVDVQWSDIPKLRVKLCVSLVSYAGASDEEIAVVVSRL
ncbi:uncharacterized protein LOC143222255 isoform X2 [Tachypleus tridentatus]|uniref:uncharacterized protein LOC143222255 isoform X2 n=1 Tax=Tachypleus tridentatus TaxID=6853 RepID=UPI003FD0DAB2